MITKTKEELADMLNLRQYGNEVDTAIRVLAEDSNLVIVYGISDDLMGFEGAIRDEGYCYNGGTAYLTETGLFESKCKDDDCPYALAEMEKCKTIDAVLNNGCPAWTYKTDIPHATFDIMEDDEVYCRGIVFDMDSVKNNPI